MVQLIARLQLLLKGALYHMAHALNLILQPLQLLVATAYRVLIKRNSQVKRMYIEKLGTSYTQVREIVIDSPDK